MLRVSFKFHIGWMRWVLTKEKKKKKEEEKIKTIIC